MSPSSQRPHDYRIQIRFGEIKLNGVFRRQSSRNRCVCALCSAHCALCARPPSVRRRPNGKWSRKLRTKSEWKEKKINYSEMHEKEEQSGGWRRQPAASTTHNRTRPRPVERRSPRLRAFCALCRIRRETSQTR